MKAILFVISFVFVCTVCEAQRRYGYAGSSHSIPVFSDKYDSKIGMKYSTSGGLKSYSGIDSSEREESKTNGLDLEAAFAITKHIVLQANYFHRWENSTSLSKSNFADSKIKYKRNMMEFGIGYFHSINKKENLYFQLYAGAGFGKTGIKESGLDLNQLPYNRSYDAAISKFYLEPSLTLRTRAAIEVTVFTRASNIKFRNIHSDYTKSEATNLKLDSLDRFSILFVEPGVIGSFGFRRLPGIRIDVQLSASILRFHSFIKYWPENLAIGLAIDIPKLIKWQKYRPYKW